MGLTVEVAQHFLLALALGMGAFPLSVDTQLTGVGFYKAVLSIVAGGLILSLGIHLIYSEIISIHSALYLLTLIILVFLFKYHRDRRSGLMVALHSFKTVSVALISFLFLGKDWPSFLYFISSSLFLGSVLFAMVLGHWYLVTPRLTERPLMTALKIMWVTMAIKMTITLGEYFQKQAFFESGASLGMGHLFNWLMLTMRVIWGYLIIAVLSYFAWRLVKMRSFQSATGLFYVMTFFTLVGEMISTFLFHHYGLRI